MQDMGTADYGGGQQRVTADAFLPPDLDCLRKALHACQAEVLVYTYAWQACKAFCRCIPIYLYLGYTCARQPAAL